jgi:predicted aldo/keto reductase-like oxidoreductase
MNYRTNPKTGEKVSLLGFGMMRLPLTGKDEKDIDEEKAIAMLRYAIDHGVNYVDTAYVYHGGYSEVVTGKALKDGYRERATIATKLPFAMAKEEAELQKFLDESLRRLDVDYIDFYLVHGIDDGSYQKAKELKVFDFMKQAKASGKVKKVGFSYHGNTPEFFKQLIDENDWDFVQIQLNYMDSGIQAGIEGLKYAGEKGIPVVIMEPLKGGKITDKVPPTVQSLWDKSEIKRTPADWAFRWVADFPEVTTILSGMSTMEQVVENVEILDKAEPNSLTAEDKSIISEVAAKYGELIAYGCTACRYCMPCPVGLDIPGLISWRNDATRFDAADKTAGALNSFIFPKPTACISCKKCEEACPQHLVVSDIMKEMVELYM